ncbi:SMODS domain-containing nucleotidyltransferase [Aureimonas psammosilenae]|uniref:SMODS domain-containing nucleotidyltransferase n=1 Tax=Aureimonas psammosilenae TaxID=2495496 RepID=UPI00186A8B91|nr:nucleotidyltransferase [Aureimonas psammosilenae]
MKLPNDFNAFLRDTVNLNQTRLSNLESNVEALKNFLRQQDWGVKIRTFQGQGSWAHNTIIKPVDGGEFDADLLVMVDPVEGWTAKQYVDALYRVFLDSETYKGKVTRYRYCVTITYVGDRKVDIAPCIKDRRWTDTYEVCNRDADAFEVSAPAAYTAWINERNGYSGKNSFRKVTRLLKYLRDIKGRFTCPSVLLTTMIGNQINFWDKDATDFEDTPTTLQTIMGRLDNWLQANESKPKVVNPKLDREDFAAQLTQDQYANFRNVIHRYRGWVDEACEAKTRTDSIKAWRRLFGDDFAKGENVSVLSKGNLVERASLGSLVLSTAAHLDSLVDEVINFGRSVLPAAFYRPPHQKTPPWRALETISRNVQVTAVYQRSQWSSPGQSIGPGDALPRSGGLWFTATINNGQAVPEGFRVEWRITNTGTEALMHHSGRGKFYAGQRIHSRWEGLSYRGVHIAEAFIIRTQDEVLVGQSAPFEVVIR